MKRRNISSGSDWEKQIGFSQAVCVGPFIQISALTPVDAEGKVIGIRDAYEQTKQILTNLQATLEHAGAEMADVVRTRIYVKDLRLWQEIGRAHGEVFQDIKPATSMLEVSRMTGPDFLVSIEADAIIDESAERV
ncbi:RidA family protein [Piscirickettsia salmonis]|uniref:RidA family protein n=1 Tax=Piscirickettsia salmonis TaxID=1238 RepID=UPI0007C8D060|nr:Enamine/imine deaminase [Piscirickettsiaceae bacterium NZ-RLO1]